MKKLIVSLQFKYSVFKCRWTYRCYIKYFSKYIITCLGHAYNIGYPVTKEEKEYLKWLITECEITIEQINKDIAKYKQYLE